MKRKQKQWNKLELKTYILLLCAKADQVEAEEELDLIKSKTSTDTFEKMYREFGTDTEDESLEKIQNSIQQHAYSFKEIAELKKEIQEIFLADRKLFMKEHNLGLMLENILY